MSDKRIKHPDRLDPKYKARHWAYKHGFYGAPGGWIYREGTPARSRRHRYSPKPVCQGWMNFYKIFGHQINRWFRNRYLKAQETTK